MVAFSHLVPALYFNTTVRLGQSLGNLSTGGVLTTGQALSGNLRSEPGFEPGFTAEVLYGIDYPTMDAVKGYARFNALSLVVPDDGSTPFQMHNTGIQYPTNDTIAIMTTNTTELSVPYGETYSVWVCEFRGGSEKYANLQDSIFIGSQTVRSGDNPGEFVVGVKISKVFNSKTDVLIGQEFDQ